MRLILLKNKKIFDSDVVASLEKIFAVIRQNWPWPFGLRQTSSPATSLRLPVVPLRAARNSLRSNNICQQQNNSYFINGA